MLTKFCTYAKGFCEVDGCGKERGVVGQKLEGGVLVASLCCEKGHKNVCLCVIVTG